MTHITALSSFTDNYIWRIAESGGKVAAFVDPGDAAPVLRALEQADITPVAILLTHHHADHVGGVAHLVARYPDIPVFGPAKEAIPAVTQPVGEGDVVEIPGTGLAFRVMEVPGHTKGHIAFHGHDALFCGDTLFSVGCGRLFEGTPEAMQASLGKIAALPGKTLVYCAHEYTLDNIRFAKWVEPGNLDLLIRETQAFARIDRDTPTVPSTLAEELATNPFLRWEAPAVIAAAEKHAGRRLSSGAAVFGALRRWKDDMYR
uniref:Hydroxyacylglutathione hydrolase n=1 Tax=Candidatus Kentrum eta TaxID=2126337 RepID=A0A450UD70_9GAMM|nr:MAG: hydroxyacylglutathione hydrolase [Candidatus Kentron sp. H]VFJ91587.1 MAG: hydroxyacylglutathione hydrolase [Candidatus Kentron sp. H]VFJ98177.1 MAG: hydroxyacylglutathione hydrolase [Candidatus Kentron sp. H]